MGAQHENAVRAFIGEIEGDRWNAAQVERILSRLTPDARYHVYAGSVRLRVTRPFERSCSDRLDSSVISESRSRQ
jgi:hypothetical protein